MQISVFWDLLMDMEKGVIFKSVGNLYLFIKHISLNFTENEDFSF